MYTDQVMDHFMHPRNVGNLPDASGCGQAQQPTCGDVVRLFVCIEAGRVTKATFQAHGCGPGIACASLITERITGQTVEEAAAWTAQRVARSLGGLPAPKRHCAELVVRALQDALHDLQRRALGGGVP